MKERTTSLKFNMVMNAILTMSNIVFPLITFPYVTRILLPAGTGRVSFAVSIITYFSMFAQLGIPTYGIRACAKVRDDKEKLSRIVHELLMINMIMVLISYVAFGISLFAVPRFARDKELLLVISIIILLNAMGVEWLYKALEKYSYIRSVVFKLIALVAMFALIHDESDYIIYGAITIFAASASNVLNFINLRKYVILKPLGGYHLKKHLKPMLVFFSMSVATVIYTNLDSVMLGFMKDDAQVGIYTAAVKVKSILVTLITSASAVLLPRASKFVDQGKMEDFYRILKKTLHFIIVVALPMCIYFILFANESILLLSGKAFADATLPMQIIMPTLLLIGITNLTGIQMMIPLGMERYVLYSEIGGALVDIILNAILIPEYGAAGAALGTLVAELVVLLIQLFAVRDKLKELFAGISYLKIILAMLIALASVWWLATVDWSVFITLLLSALIYFGVYGILLLIMKDKLVTELIGQLVKKVK